MTFVLLAALLAYDLADVRKEPNPEHRCDLALTHADTALTAARQAYAADDLEKTKSVLEEVGEAVELAHDSLVANGKDARRNPRYFKRAELSIRQLLRRLDGLRDMMSSADRHLVDPVRQRANDVHDALIRDIMGKRR
jgi:hypothetical protein